MGGRGSESKLPKSPGPSGGGGGETKWGQPDTPQNRPPAPTIEGVIGEKGRVIGPYDATTKVNPYRNIEYGDYSMNCQRCVVAYELNRRGYQVEAEATWENDPYPRGAYWATAFKGGSLEDVGGSTTAEVNKNILSEMRGWGTGSRAIVEVGYPGGLEGHVFNVEYHSGRLYYYDAQTGTRYDGRTVFNNVHRESVRIMRSDNLEIGENIKDMVRMR